RCNPFRILQICFTIQIRLPSTPNSIRIQWDRIFSYFHFIPNPSFRGGNFEVTSGDGIEFLAFIVFFSLFITPSIMEYLKLNPTLDV
ncbi:MAG: hypothetical protein ACTSR4_05950, partial [Candidatus Hodarchaeales archaeon]